MAAKTLMVQGTASYVGKSLIVTALCRIFRQDGFRVAPFKAQNMALNSFVTWEGGEMGRSQVVQAEAAGIEPSVDMNPVLLKPEAGSRCQVILGGKPLATVAAGEYHRLIPQLLTVVEASLRRLLDSYDIVVLEGAGSPAEINLRQGDMVNMAMARLAASPVLLVGDIDRGGVFASLVGTLALLTDEERTLVRGLIINKFRGDLALLRPGLAELERLTGKPVLGVVPYHPGLSIPEEDSVGLGARPAGEGTVDIAVIRLPYISNFTDFAPLEHDDDVRLHYVNSVEEMGHPDLIILPGTKSTIADLDYLWRTGLAAGIVGRAQGGTAVMGICGGFQVLGRRVSDPLHVESSQDSLPGLGLLDMETVFEPVKTTYQAEGVVVAGGGLLAGAGGQVVRGYEIHMGQTSGQAMPAFRITRRGDMQVDSPDGAVAPGGWVVGTYLHGIFDNDGLRHAMLDNLRQRKGLSHLAPRPLPTSQEQHDSCARLVRSSLNMELIYRIAGLSGAR